VSTLAILLFLATQTVSSQKVSDTIVVTASALPESAQSTPAAVTVITRKEIESRAARDVADVLREVPGVTVSRTGSPGRATSLFTRGAGSTHTLVLWNGIELNNPYFAGYDWGRFSTAGVEQVEVVRGPYSALYGSDAVAGVVNVLTTPSRSEIGGGAEAGGNGLRNGRLGASYVRDGQIVSVALERREDDGFSRNDDFSQNSASLLWRWTASDAFSIGLAGRYTGYDLGIPFNLNGDASALVPSLRRRQDGSERQIAIPIAQTLGRFSYELALSESRRRDDFDDPDDPFGYVGGSTRSLTRRAKLSTKTASPIGTLVAGAEIERAKVDDLTNFGPNLLGSRRSERSFFLEDRVSRGAFELAAGVRYDHYDTFGSETSPRLAAAWLAGNHKLRAAYGEAFRAPSIGELYFPFAGNLALHAEHSRSAEIGYDHASGFSATIFSSRYRDLIVFDNATFAFSNVGRATSRGAELSMQHDFGALRAGAAYTILDKPLPRRPRHSGSLFAGYHRGNAETNVVITHSGARGDILPVFPFSSVNDRAVTTVDINAQLHLARITPYVRIENATDERYEEVRGYPSPRRRATAGIRFTLDGRR
jgi:vitamin B12 transporter